MGSPDSPSTHHMVGVAGSDAPLADRLAALLESQSGRQVTVRQVTPLAGHAGVAYSFVTDDGVEARKMMVRTIAPNAPATGPSDVVRQARIMQSLRGSAVPVPQIHSLGDHTSVFGRPYFVAEFVEGTGLPPKREDQEDVHAALARSGVEVMARLHQIPCTDLDSAWGPPRGVHDEFERLHRLFDRPTIDASRAGRVERLRERLLASAPEHFSVGCVHGDLHFNNMIFGPNDVRSVIDWEIAFLGSTLLDLGMLTFYADPQAGIPEHRHRAERWVLSPDEIIETYRTALGTAIAVDAIAWHRAFAGYRFGIITLFNEMLHRRGKKHDPMWSDTIRSVPTMMERSLELLDS
ncbi:MAG: phosphotransferase family protein [Stagnimonas sp.]|nr:phosphotransferase family protein [Stagnimonas sp.]